MLRGLLLLVLAILVVRVVLRVLGGVVATPSRQRRPQAGGRGSDKSVQMVRDPVCGTFVIPDRAIVLADGSRQVFFCSAQCRDKYRVRSA